MKKILAFHIVDIYRDQKAILPLSFCRNNIPSILSKNKALWGYSQCYSENLTPQIKHYNNSSSSSNNEK